MVAASNEMGVRVGNLIIETLRKPIERIKIDPIRLPPLRDVYEPFIRNETVRFNPTNGEIFIFCQKNERGQIAIDNFVPQKESPWLSSIDLNAACAISEKFISEDGSKIIDNTGEVIQSTVDDFPQFFSHDLDEKEVTSIITRICSNLVQKKLITDENNQDYIKDTLHNYRGIRSGHYSNQEKKSRLGSVVLDVVNDLIKERGKVGHYSPALAILLVEQQIENRFFKSLIGDFSISIGEQLKPNFNNLQGFKKSLLELEKKYFSFPIFRCAFAKQSAEKIKKTILEINKIIDEFSDWNPGRAVNIINDFIMLQ
jgi:hypothetical protein